MTPAEKRYIVEVLEAQAGRARVLARLYEDAAETVAGFDSEAAMPEFEPVDPRDVEWWNPSSPDFEREYAVESEEVGA